ncbi:MAG: type II secretion system protein [Gammaproteobacteria bacterium]|nr:type II secretion system protein [Gammaproteobacteria bacterium]
MQCLFCRKNASKSLGNKYIRGFSLVELSIVLVIVGAITSTMLALWPQIQQIFVQVKNEKHLEAASKAIDGFLIAHSRLPCPDSDGDGYENCSVSSGTLPYRTLELGFAFKSEQGQQFAYSVYRNANANAANDTDLASILNRFSPVLPNGETSTQSNGVDFCWALKQAAGIPYNNLYTHVGVGSEAINQAYVLALPGHEDKNGNGRLFDGVNQVGNAGFELPSKGIDTHYDDIVLSVGFHQLSGRLACPTLLSEVNTSARNAYALYDALSLMEYTKSFRDFALDVNNGGVEQASFNMALAVLDLAIYVADTTIAFAVGLESFEIALPTFIIPAALAGAMTELGIVLAAIDLADAISARDDSIVQVAEAQAHLTDITTQYQRALLEAKNRDARGWF